MRWSTEHYMLVDYTVQMSEKTGRQETADLSKTWQPTQYANVVRHVPSGIYYARLRIKGKRIWQPLAVGRSERISRTIAMT